MHSKRSTWISTLFLCLAGLAGVFLAPAANAQSLDTFMRIDGIPGDSLASGHINDIVLTSYSQSFAPGRACSKVVAQKFMDRASPALISRAAGNFILPSVIIAIRKNGAVPFDFFRAVLESVSIERIDVSGETGRLIEQIVLRPRNIRIELRQQDATGQPGPAIVTNIDCN